MTTNEYQASLENSLSSPEEEALVDFIKEQYQPQARHTRRQVVVKTFRQSFFWIVSFILKKPKDARMSLYL